MKTISRRDFLKAALGFSLLGLTGCMVEGKPAETGKPSSLETYPIAPELKTVDYDYLLVNGTIVDGSGSKPYTGHLAIKGDKIAAVGNSFLPGRGGEVIDVSGLMVAPGFIDLHTHTEEYLLKNGKAEMILLQGVTTHIGGNCGTSRDSLEKYFLELRKTGVNVGLFAGLKNIRMMVVGTRATLTEGDLQKMKELLAQAMEEGAFGLSVGLQYWPQSYTTTEELIELCHVVGEYGGFYSTHIRDEGDNVIPSVEEAVRIGLEAGVPVEYSHIKTALKPNWGKMPEVLKIVEEAANKGLDITADVYGYEFSSLDIGKNRSSINEEDMLTALKHPLVMVGSDSGLSVNGNASHPRAYGNYPRILGRYIRERKVLSLEECVRKMTSMPAGRLGLIDRGLLREGYAADVAVFNFNNIIDRAERDAPNRYSEGMEFVFVNGKPAVKNGKPTGELNGYQLKK